MPFDGVQTPANIQIIIEGVEKGPNWWMGDGEPNNGTFDLVQDGIDPCAYATTGWPYSKFVTFKEGFIECAGSNVSPALFFRNFGILYDDLIGDNTVADHFIEGSVKIIVPGITL